MKNRHKAIRGMTMLAGLSLAAAATAQPETLRPRTFAIHFNPIIESSGGKRLYDVPTWWPNVDPSVLESLYISDMTQASNGRVNHRLVREIDADVHPIKIDGFRYTDTTYMTALTDPGTPFHMPDGVDYKAIVRDYDLARKVDFGEIDEVHISGAPYFGYYESTMAGVGGYFVNSGPQQRIASSRLFIIMGFNYERGVAEMLHSNGHRTESIMTRTYGSWSTSISEPRHDWDRFGRNFGQSPDDFALGSVHYPPNADADYDYGDTRVVTSTSTDWLNNYPNLTGQTSSVSLSTWGGPDYHRNFLKWWYRHVPDLDGRNSNDGYDRLNNWWSYIYDFNSHAESGGEHLPGGTGQSAQPSPVATVAVSTSPGDDLSPRVSSAGRVVWSGFDGTDYEIYAANADGTGFVQVTDNAIDDEAPQISDGGKLVWQAFDGQDYEIFTADDNGANLLQITNNSVNDWHPQINASGRIVWDAFDGQDYEIKSANADGSNLVTLTSNTIVGDYPQDDVWPQINAGGRVVWFGREGDDWEIFAADATGGAVTKITNNTYDDEYPQINDSGRVVWHAYLTNDNSEIFSAPASGGAIVQLSSSPGFDWYPQIDGSGRVVWMGRSNGAWDVLESPATGGGAQSLTCNESLDPCQITHDQHPQIDDCGRVVWQGFDGSDWEIYALIDGVTYRLSDNDYDDLAPFVSPTGRVVWHGESTGTASGPTFSIFSADLSTTACSFVGSDCTAAAPPPQRDPITEEVTTEFLLPFNAGTLPSMALAGDTLYTLDSANDLRSWNSLTQPPSPTFVDDASEIDFGAGPNATSVMVHDPASNRLLVLANNLNDPNNPPTIAWRDLSGFNLAAPAGFALLASGDLLGGNIGDHAASLLTFGDKTHVIHAWLGAPYYPSINTDGTAGPTLNAVGNRWAGATTEAFPDGQSGAQLYYLQQTDSDGNPISTSPLTYESIFFKDFQAGQDCDLSGPVSPTSQTLPWTTACGDGGCVNRHSMEFVPATNRIWVLRGDNTNEIGVYDIDDDDWGIIRLTRSGSPFNLTRADLQLVGDRMFVLTAGRREVVSVDATADGQSPVCPCEFTDDDPANVDIFDLLAYLDAWFAGTPEAEYDGIPGVDIFDLLAYLDCWFSASGGAPCPG